MKIHEYAANGDCEGVRKELRRGANVDARNEQDFTPLACAAGSSRADSAMLRALLDAGADMNAAVDGNKNSPVGVAAEAGDLDKLQCLLDAGADVNVTSPDGYTPLIHVMYRVRDDDRLLAVVEALLRRGATIDCASSYKESPLSVSAIQGRFRVVKCLLDAGADPSRLRWTALLKATAVGTLSEVEQLIAGGANLGDRDFCDRTAWLLSAAVGDVDKARLLLTHGADLEDRGRMGETALIDCAARGHRTMVCWLIDSGADLEATDEAGNTPLMIASREGRLDCVRVLLEAGADPGRKNSYDENAISMATSEPIVRQLLQAGEDIGDISREMKRILTRMEGSDALNVTQGEYLSGRFPRFGRSNPEVMNIPFWREMLRSGVHAYGARVQFDDTNGIGEPVWCFDRFGTSFTELPDGRYVQIGGEHEDYYDPDFCIYNDVIVHEPSGEFTILGYPRDLFPPTDFHSASYFNGFIYIIGGLGYQGERQFGFTPVYRVNCKTWKIEDVRTSGDNPGWIYKHKASQRDPGVVVISGGTICDLQAGEEQHVANSERFRLNLATTEWTRL